MQIPHTRASKDFASSPTSAQRPGRFSTLIHPYDGSPVDIGLLGVPCDIGVKQGGGRPGAALGPAAIRNSLAHYGTSYNVERNIDLAGLNIADFGDLICDEASLENTHQKLTEAVAEIVRLGAIPLIFGGSHDLSFAAIRGLAEVKQTDLGGLTLDAHFDVREVKDGLITSGTPFRRILETLDGIEGIRFVEIGINGLINTREHQEYLSEKQSRIFFLDEVRHLGMATVMTQALEIASCHANHLFCSIDLDAVAQAFAPGVSAPSPEGLSPEEVSLAAYLTGLHEKTAYFDLMELNPRFDCDGRTARLAAALVLHFVSGVAQRKTAPTKGIDLRKDAR